MSGRGPAGLVTVALLGGCRAGPPSAPGPAPAPASETRSASAPGPGRPLAEPVAALGSETPTWATLAVPGDGLLQHQHPGPSLILAHALEAEPGSAAGDLTAALLDGDGYRRITDAELAALGVTRPAQAWLFGPDGACPASLGSAYALAEDDGFVTLELGVELAVCTPEPAPIVALDPGGPALAWRPVACEAPHRVEAAGASLTGDALAWYTQLDALTWVPDPDDDPTPPSEHWTYTCQAGSVVELRWAWVWPERDCWDAERGGASLAVADGPRLRGFDGPDGELLGVLVDVDAAPVAVVVADAANLEVGIREAVGAPIAWATLSRGDFHDEIVAYARRGWSVMDCESEP